MCNAAVGHIVAQSGYSAFKERSYYQQYEYERKEGMAASFLVVVFFLGSRLFSGLFGLYRLEAFPKDVWIKRAMASLFPEGLPECASEYAGIAQQYIFHYARNMGMLKDK